MADGSCQARALQTCTFCISTELTLMHPQRDCGLGGAEVEVGRRGCRQLNKGTEEEDWLESKGQRERKK